MIDVGEFGVQKLTRIYFYGKFNDNCLIGQTKCCVLISICFKCCLQTCNFDLIDVTKITDSGPPILQPSTCFRNLLLNLEVQSVASFINNLLKINFEQIAGVFPSIFYHC